MEMEPEMELKGLNLARLKNCMRRAEEGGNLTIGFFGGSITQGCCASVHEKSYAYRVFDWWRAAFPQAGFGYVNGGIGGTSSHFGVSRVVSDMLMYQPDIVTLDFSVNDGANALSQETFEGLIRRILTWTSKPAVLILNNICYDTGVSAQDYHNEAGARYQLPCVSMRDTLYRRMKAGWYTGEEITKDYLHPNDRGHELVAAEIIRLLEKVKECMWEEETEMPLPNPVTENAYENARRLTIRECSPKLEGFRADHREKEGHLDSFKNGWIGEKAGDRIIFETEASCIAVQYRKTVARPALRARLILDGDVENPVLLDGNFELDWGDCLYLEPVLHHGRKAVHRIEIEILDDGIRDAAPFYLLSLIVA